MARRRRPRARGRRRVATGEPRRSAHGRAHDGCAGTHPARGARRVPGTSRGGGGAGEGATVRRTVDQDRNADVAQPDTRAVVPRVGGRVRRARRARQPGRAWNSRWGAGVLRRARRAQQPARLAAHRSRGDEPHRRGPLRARLDPARRGHRGLAVRSAADRRRGAHGRGAPVGPGAVYRRVRARVEGTRRRDGPVGALDGARPGPAARSAVGRGRAAVGGAARRRAHVLARAVRRAPRLGIDRRHGFVVAGAAARASALHAGRELSRARHAAAGPARAAGVAGRPTRREPLGQRAARPQGPVGLRRRARARVLARCGWRRCAWPLADRAAAARFRRRRRGRAGYAGHRRAPARRDRRRSLSRAGARRRRRGEPARSHCEGPVAGYAIPSRIPRHLAGRDLSDAAAPRCQAQRRRRSEGGTVHDHERRGRRDRARRIDPPRRPDESGRCGGALSARAPARRGAAPTFPGRARASASCSPASSTPTSPFAEPSAPRRWPARSRSAGCAGRVAP